MQTDVLFQHWAEVRGGLCQALDQLSDAQLAFCPREGLWSLGQTACHIAGTEDSWIRHIVFHELDGWEEADYRAEDYPTVASLKQLLDQVHTRVLAKYEHNPDQMMAAPVNLPWGPQVRQEWVIWHVLEHEIHHRGEIYLMLGLLGLEAPDV
jgi:uncharacterized damage-inducible protein DinB